MVDSRFLHVDSKVGNLVSASLELEEIAATCKFTDCQSFKEWLNSPVVASYWLDFQCYHKYNEPGYITLSDRISLPKVVEICVEVMGDEHLRDLIFNQYGESLFSQVEEASAWSLEHHVARFICCMIAKSLETHGPVFTHDEDDQTLLNRAYDLFVYLLACSDHWEDASSGSEAEEDDSARYEQEKQVRDQDHGEEEVEAGGE